MVGNAKCYDEIPSPREGYSCGGPYGGGGEVSARKGSLFHAGYDAHKRVGKLMLAMLKDRSK